MPESFLPTLEDVALRANVSTATVSRCLNNPERVAETTRARILDVVDALGYSPNFGAKALASRRTNTVGAVIPTMANAIFARGLESLQETLGPTNTTLLVASSHYDQTIEEQQIRAMIARGADGLLLIGRNRSDKLYEFLDRRKIPYVVAWTYSEDSNYSCVGFDNIEAAEKLALRAVDMGHRHFSIITANRDTNDRAKDRVTGIQRALLQSGLSVNEDQIFEAPYSVTDAANAFKRIMNIRPQTTVVMCGNDVQAVGAIKMAKTMGITIPADMSVTGFDNLEITTVVEPAVTTIQVPHKEMGAQAAKVLLEAIKGGHYIKRIKLPTSIVERDSLKQPA